MFTSEYENAINKQFAKNLRHFLDRYNYTQLSFAKKMNVSAATVSNWCNGTKSPRMDKVDIMCSIFNCRRSDLLEANPVSVDDSIDFSAVKKKVSKRFKKIIEGRGIYLSDLSTTSGVSEYAIKHYMNGDIIPSELNAKRLGDALKINHLWLMGFDAPMNTKSTADQDERLASIIDYYQSLNDTGRSKAVERMEELTLISNYSIYDSSVSSNEAFLSSNSIQSSEDNKETQTTKGNDSQYLTPAEIDQILSKMTEEELNELINET